MDCANRRVRIYGVREFQIAGPHTEDALFLSVRRQPLLPLTLDIMLVTQICFCIQRCNDFIELNIKPRRHVEDQLRSDLKCDNLKILMLIFIKYRQLSKFRQVGQYNSTRATV